MTNLNATSTAQRELWSRVHDAGSPTPTAAAAATKRTAAEASASLQDALDRLPSSPLTLAAATGGGVRVGAALDRLQSAMSGPYRVGSQLVESPAQFRMAGGYNDDAAAPESAAGRRLDAVAAKAGLSGLVTSLRYGRGSPESLTRVTQALIDAGELQGGSSKPLGEQIHDMQWRFGIGIDCAGYVRAALSSIHGAGANLGLRSPGNENLTGLPTNPHFKAVDATEAQTGDVIVLKGSGGGDPGHNLVVRSHTLLTAASAAVTVRDAAALDFVSKSGQVHAFEVDSSFGAGETGRASGGVRRDVLLFDAGSHTWCTVRDPRESPPVVGSVPYGEQSLTGFFRPRVSP